MIIGSTAGLNIRPRLEAPDAGIDLISKTTLLYTINRLAGPDGI